MKSKSGIQTRLDLEFHELLISIQQQRVELGVDRRKRSITKLTHLCFKLLKQQNNLEKLLKISF